MHRPLRAPLRAQQLQASGRRSRHHAHSSLQCQVVAPKVGSRDPTGHNHTLEATTSRLPPHAAKGGGRAPRIRPPPHAHNRPPTGQPPARPPGSGPTGLPDVRQGVLVPKLLRVQAEEGVARPQTHPPSPSLRHHRVAPSHAHVYATTHTGTRHSQHLLSSTPHIMRVPDMTERVRAYTFIVRDTVHHSASPVSSRVHTHIEPIVTLHFTRWKVN